MKNFLPSCSESGPISNTVSAEYNDSGVTSTCTQSNEMPFQCKLTSAKVYEAYVVINSQETQLTNGSTIEYNGTNYTFNWAV